MNMMRLITISLLTLVLGAPAHEALAAHILEPLGTEIASTTPRGRMFGQVMYEYAKIENGLTTRLHLLAVDFELGLGERTQLNLAGETLLREEESGAGTRESGIEEIAFGIKHRFLDESRIVPDAAFEAEFAPSIGLKGNETALTGGLILSKNLHPRLVLHLNGAYELATERELDVAGGTDEVVNHSTWFYNLAPMIKVIPDKLMVLAEVNGRVPGSGDAEWIVAPEVIGVIQTTTFLTLQNVAFKLAVPFGLNDNSPDIGVKVGVSTLF